MSSKAAHFIAEKSLTLFKGLRIPAAVMVACAVALPAIIGGAGCTTGGVAADSAAAGAQSFIANLAAGGAFAALQFLVTVPLTTAGAGAGAGASG